MWAMDRLKMWALGRQGRYGDYTKFLDIVEQPAWYDVVGVAKWNAWVDEEGVPRVKAQQ